MALGKRVLDLRERRGWTQQHVCDLVNQLHAKGERHLTQQALQRLENRDSTTSEAAPFLAEVFGVSLRWLLSGHGRADDAEWPFLRVQRSRWDMCDAEDRGYVQAAINKALDECEANRTDSVGKRLAGRN